MRLALPRCKTLTRKTRNRSARRSAKRTAIPREVTLDTKGIESLGPSHARYEATLWYHNGRFDSELQKTETSHTYERLLSECTDKTLQTSGENGYTLSTFDP